MNVEEQLIKLIDGVSSLTTKVDALQQSVNALKAVSDRVAQHDSKLESIMTSLQRGNQKFDKIAAQFDKVDARLDTLEKAEGNKAKETIAAVTKYILVAVVGAMLGCGPMILNALAGGK